MEREYIVSSADLFCPMTWEPINRASATVTLQEDSTNLFILFLEVVVR
jgi:hypothetical protein